MRRTLLVSLLVSFLLLPRAALACPVCFGQNDSPLAAGINLGIIAMLAVTGGVLVSFASFFVHLMRRARMAAQSEAAQAGEVGQRPAEAGRFVPNV
jgi:hypothetical protein